MAFASAVGYGNLPQGNWSPEIFSKKAQIAYRNTAVVPAITNTDYFGEIMAYGDTVRIIQEPEISVSAYVRGQDVVPQDLDDDEITLTIDKANKFAFYIDDIEKRQSHIGWMDLAADRAGYKLRDTMDSEVLTYIDSQIPTANQLGTEASVTTVDVAGAPAYTPLGILNRFQSLMDEGNVPDDGRYLVADPFFYELLGDEDSKLLSVDFATPGNILRNGLIAVGQVRGFKLYKSNKLGVVGTGSRATSGTNGTWMIAGQMAAVAMAEQIMKTEQLRSHTSFGDFVRGLHVYGRKVLRADSLFGAVWRQV